MRSYLAGLLVRDIRTSCGHQLPEPGTGSRVADLTLGEYQPDELSLRIDPRPGAVGSTVAEHPRLLGTLPAETVVLRRLVQKTQERLIERATKEDEWTVFQSVLKGAWKEYLGDLQNYRNLVEEEDADSEEDSAE